MSLITKNVAQDDLMSSFGLRSTSSGHSQYSNEAVLHPYSNWRGPVWVIANALACYGLSKQGQKDQAIELADAMLSILADDLRSGDGPGWHEAYSSEDGSPLAAPGFLSWNVLSADLLSNLQNDVDPFAL